MQNFFCISIRADLLAVAVINRTGHCIRDLISPSLLYQIRKGSISISLSPLKIYTLKSCAINSKTSCKGYLLRVLYTVGIKFSYQCNTVWASSTTNSLKCLLATSMSLHLFTDKMDSGENYH